MLTRHERTVPGSPAWQPPCRRAVPAAALLVPAAHVLAPHHLHVPVADHQQCVLGYFPKPSLEEGLDHLPIC